MTINLSKAAKYYKEEPHQLAAWNWLESVLTDDQIDEFAELYRAGPANPTGRDHHATNYARTDWLFSQSV